MQNANYTTQYREVLPHERELSDITPVARKMKVDDVYHLPNPFNRDPQSRRLRMSSNLQGTETNSSLSGDPGLHRVIGRAQTSARPEREVAMTKEQMAELTTWLLQAGQTINWEREIETEGQKAA